MSFFDATPPTAGIADLAALDLPHRELSVWMIETTSHAAVHEAIVERRDIESGAFADELVTLWVAYGLRRQARHPRP